MDEFKFLIVFTVVLVATKSYSQRNGMPGYLTDRCEGRNTIVCLFNSSEERDHVGCFIVEDSIGTFRDYSFRIQENNLDTLCVRKYQCTSHSVSLLYQNEDYVQKQSQITQYDPATALPIYRYWHQEPIERANATYVQKHQIYIERDFTISFYFIDKDGNLKEQYEIQLYNYPLHAPIAIMNYVVGNFHIPYICQGFAGEKEQNHNFHKQYGYNRQTGLLDWTCSYTQDGRIDTLARYDEGILRSLLVGDSCFVSNDTLWHQAHAVLYYPSGCIEAEYDYRWADGDDPEIDWGYESNKKSYPDCCTMIILDPNGEDWYEDDGI